MNTGEPMLKVGMFGVHAGKNPAGTFSFVGEVPRELSRKCFNTLAESETAFVSWLKSQPVEFQREHVGNLRNDIFAKFMNS